MSPGPLTQGHHELMAQHQDLGPGYDQEHQLQAHKPKIIARQPESDLPARHPRVTAPAAYRRASAQVAQVFGTNNIDDPVKSLVMGLPADLVFRTKGQLAIDVCADAFADGIRFDFMCGHEVYGRCTGLREFLEGHGQGYVLRVPSNFHLTLARRATVTC